MRDWVTLLRGYVNFFTVKLQFLLKLLRIMQESIVLMPSFSLGLCPLNLALLAGSGCCIHLMMFCAHLRRYLLLVFYCK